MQKEKAGESSSRSMLSFKLQNLYIYLHLLNFSYTRPTSLGPNIQVTRTHKILQEDSQQQNKCRKNKTKVNHLTEQTIQSC